MSSFVGRGREVAEIEGLLAGTRLVTLTGPGGCGKMRLALAVASDLIEEFGDGVWWVGLAPLSDLVPQAVTSALGVRESPGRPPTEALVEHLGAKETLLILTTFSEAMRTAMIKPTTFKLRKLGATRRVAAMVTYDPAIKRAILNPEANLRAGTTYVATVTTGARDLAGNRLDQDPNRAGNQQKVWRFTVKQLQGTIRQILRPLGALTPFGAFSSGGGGTFGEVSHVTPSRASRGGTRASSRSAPSGYGGPWSLAASSRRFLLSTPSSASAKTLDPA